MKALIYFCLMSMKQKTRMITMPAWCVGFMEGFFYQEETWFGKGEDIAAELLLPIMALSGLFDSDEFQEIRRNEKILSQFEEIMPEQLVDIFLFYHSD